MQTNLESTGNISRKLSVVIPSEKIQDEVDLRLKSLRSRVRIDGFRPGKVPMSVVSQRHGDAVFQEVVGEMFQSSFYEAATKEKLRVAGSPEIDATVLELGKDLEYTATFEVYPDIEISDLTKVKVVKPKVEIVDSDIDDMVETLRKQSKSLKEVSRKSKKDDLMIVDFVGTLDGEEFEGGSAEDFSVEIGAGNMVKDFEKALKGMKAGEEKTADVAFPEDYPAENLSGKTAQFNLKVKKVSQAILPDVDEEFIKKFGVASGKEADFRADIKGNLEQELKQRLQMKVKQSVMDALSDAHDVELPASLVADEIQQVRQELTQNSQQDMSSVPDDLFREQAARRVKLGLIVGEVITQNNLKKDDKRVESMLNEMAASYEDPSVLLEYYRTNQQAMQTIEAAVMEEMIVDYVLDKAKVSSKKMKFSEIMNPAVKA